jgi:hypothetical protein
LNYIYFIFSEKSGERREKKNLGRGEIRIEEREKKKKRKKKGEKKK